MQCEENPLFVRQNKFKSSKRGLFYIAMSKKIYSLELKLEIINRYLEGNISRQKLAKDPVQFMGG